MFKAGFVGIIGKPNAGKSSLVNKMVGEKVAIISSKPQTTRDNILGIKTGENYQIVFVDTPGVHRSKNHLDKVMMKNVRSAINGVNVIVYLIDGSKKVDEDERKYIEHLPENKIVVINCEDVKKNYLCKLYSQHCSLLFAELLYGKEHDFLFALHDACRFMHASS